MQSGFIPRNLKDRFAETGPPLTAGTGYNDGWSPILD
jgi:hypothetical protein